MFQTVHVMLLLPESFKRFVPAEKTIADSKKVSEVLLCISVDEKEEVDSIISTAVKGGGKAVSLYFSLFATH